MDRRIEHVWIDGPAGALEAQILHPRAPRAAAALLCHPHPAQGGTMHTKVLYHAARGLVDAGVPALRFNFRGVGRSPGAYTGGPGERGDVRAALAFAKERWPGVPLVVGGFSFGSWVGLDVGRDDPAVAALIGIAPPVALFDFTFLHGTRTPLCFLAGDRDPFCPISALRGLAGRFDPPARVDVFAGAEHLLTTHLAAVAAAVGRFATACLGDTERGPGGL